MTVVLGVRHGDVENTRGLCYGRAPGFPLSAAGRERAERTGRLLASAPIVAVWASPLERAVETAEAIAQPHGLAVRENERLIEWAGLARWQGRPWSALPQDPEVRRIYEDPVGNCPDDPLDAMGARVLAWAGDAAAVAEEAAGGIVIGVSHEAPLVAAYIVGRGADPSSFRAVNIPLLSGVRLLPGPTELVDPVEALRAC